MLPLYIYVYFLFQLPVKTTKSELSHRFLLNIFVVKFSTFLTMFKHDRVDKKSTGDFGSHVDCLLS